tara:strand:+ start:116 stop:661 length:546 start_codon:yes stop_codon:yes gene_type:complete
MEMSFERKLEPLDLSLVSKPCQQGSQIDTRKCSHLWPRYPCYRKKHLSCENTDGVELVDPIDNVLYAVGESYVALGNLSRALLDMGPKDKRDENEEKLIRYFRQYGTELFPFQETALKIADTVRFVDVQDKLAQAKGIFNTNPSRGGGGRSQHKSRSPRKRSSGGRSPKARSPQKRSPNTR